MSNNKTAYLRNKERKEEKGRKEGRKKQHVLYILIYLFVAVNKTTYTIGKKCPLKH
jgi:hypothetical protein